MKKPRLQAHRGVSSEFPENTFAAFDASVAEGYDIIELDPKYTSDKKFVILHDRTLARTGRTANGEKFTTDINVADTTLDYLRTLDFGVWKNEKFKGEKIPVLSEVIEYIRAHSIPFKFDNVWETFPDEIRENFLSELKEAKLGNKIGFTCRKLPTFRRAAELFPEAELHWDGVFDEETLREVSEIAKSHRLTVWVCYDGDTSRWYKGERTSRELCDRVRKIGEVGVWILSTEEEYRRAVTEYAPDAIETTGSVKPYMFGNI